MAGCQGTRRAASIRTFPQTAGASRSPGRLAAAMTSIEAPGAGSLRPAHRDPGQTWSQGPRGLAGGAEMANPEPASSESPAVESPELEPPAQESPELEAATPGSVGAKSANPEP